MFKVIKSRPGQESDTPDPGARPNNDPFAEGALIDRRFRIVRRASRWTVGQTFLAHDLEAGETVVLVTPDAPQDQVAGFIQRLRADADHTRPLHGGPLVTIHHAGLLNDGQPFFGLRHVAGTSLWKHIKSEGPLPTEVGLNLFEELVLRVKQAHDSRVYLGDIRPANILLVESAEGVEPELIDLGYARGLFDGVIALPAPSPAYRSPQQRRHLPLSAADDIYALGAVLYFILTARPPRAGNVEDPTIMVGADMGEPVTPPSVVRPDLDFSMYIDQVILTALATRPEDRYRNLDDLLQGVEGLRELFSLSPSARAMLYNEAEDGDQTVDIHPSEMRGLETPRPQRNVQPPVRQEVVPQRRSVSTIDATLEHTPAIRPQGRQRGREVPPPQGTGTRPFDPNELVGPPTPRRSRNEAEDPYRALDDAWDQPVTRNTNQPISQHDREDGWGAGPRPMTFRGTPPPSARRRPLPMEEAATRPHDATVADGLPSPLEDELETLESPAVKPAARGGRPARHSGGQRRLPPPSTVDQDAPTGPAQPIAPVQKPAAEAANSALATTADAPPVKPVETPDASDPFVADPLKLEVEPAVVPTASAEGEAAKGKGKGKGKEKAGGRGKLIYLAAAAVLLGVGGLAGLKLMGRDQGVPPANPTPAAEAPATAGAEKAGGEKGPSEAPAQPEMAPEGQPGALAANAAEAGKPGEESPAAAPSEKPEGKGDPEAAPAPPAQVAHLEIRTEPEGAEVIADETGEVLCKKTPCTVERPAAADGKLAVRFDLKGYKSQTRTLSLEGDKAFKFSLSRAWSRKRAEDSDKKSSRRKASKPEKKVAEKKRPEKKVQAKAAPAAKPARKAPAAKPAEKAPAAKPAEKAPAAKPVAKPAQPVAKPAAPIAKPAAPIAKPKAPAKPAKEEADPFENPFD